MKLPFSGLLLIALVACSLTKINAQRQTRTPAPQPFEQVKEEGDRLPQDVFAEKGLPEPPVLGSDPSDALAASLAKDISKYDERSLGLLMAGLQKGGFYIIDQSGKILYAPAERNSLSVAFFDFEVAGMLKASSVGAVTSMGKIAETIVQNDPQMSQVVTSSVVLGDVRKARTSKYPQVRFLSALIMELGRNMPVPVDLATASPDRALINMIQASIIERVMLRDFLKLAEDTMGYVEPGRTREMFRANSGSFLFVNASLNQSAACDLITDITAIQKDEKNAKKVIEALAMYEQLFDWRTIQKGFEKVNLPSFTKIDFLKKFANGTKAANAVFTWVKLIMALANIKISVDVEAPMPLIRTKGTRQPGGQARKLTAKFNMDIANTPLINCVGKGLNSVTGLSFSLPKGGPMVDVPVSWELLDIGDTPDKYVATPVYLDSLEHDDLSKKFTDSKGESTVQMTGKPQRKSFEDIKAVPLPKKAVVRISVATEKMKAKDDIPKIFSNLFGPDVGAGNIALGIINLIPEMLGKMKLNSYTVSVPVRDWQQCTADWGGTITVKHEWSKTEVLASSRLINGNTTGSGIRRQVIQNEADITLRPRQPEEIGIKPPYPAVMNVRGKYSDITEYVREKDPCCGNKDGSFTTKVRKGSEMKYTKTLDKSVGIIYGAKSRDYELGFGVDMFSFPVVYRNFQEIESDCDSEEESFSRDEENTFGLSYILTPGRYGDRVVNSEGELLYGSIELNTPSGKFTWSWALARCPD